MTEMASHVIIVLVVLIALAVFWKEALRLFVVGIISLLLIGIIQLVAWFHQMSG
jgi:hypothetical protein